MQQVVLGSTGLTVSRLGFGGIPIQAVGSDEAVHVVKAAFERGITFFDTARNYTSSEERIGEALAGKRDKVVIATKSVRRRVESLAAEMETSLRNLRTDYIDLYQLHNLVGDEQLDLAIHGGLLDYLHRAREEGRIRFIGVTSHRLETIVKAAATGLFDTVQFPFNFIEDAARDKLFPVAREKNIGIIAMKPLAGGAIRFPGAALKWLWGEKGVVAIPGVLSVEQLEENLRAEKDGVLTKNELASLEVDRNELGPTFCRRCMYCLPCPNGIDVNFLVTAELFFQRSGWGRMIPEHIEKFKKGLSCAQCGECESKCPYQLPLTTLVTAASRRLLSRAGEMGLERN